MRYVSMPFSQEVLLGQRGISIELMKQMLDLMPQDTKMIGCGIDQTRHLNYMFFTSDMFKDVTDYMVPPYITPYFIRNSDGSVKCEKIDFGDAKDPQVSCLHSWTTHVGFRDSYEYCKLCSVRKV